MTKPVQLRETLVKSKKKSQSKVGRPRIFEDAIEIKPRLYFDLDGVIADFEMARTLSESEHDVFKLQAGIYFSLPPYPGALAGLNDLKNAGCDIWIATKIPSENPGAASEKLYWVKQYLPWLIKKVIITPDKGILGTEHDYLIDDRPHKANCDDFAGTLLHFGPGKAIPDWEALLGYLNDVLNLGLPTDMRHTATL